MAIFRHELRQGRMALAVWTASLAALLALCVALFPQMEGEAVGELFASMGGFTAAFGMDRLDVGTLAGFYAVECGSILSLGGAFFACLGGISALCGEERDGTAEFLLTHPLPRACIAGGKLAALLARIAVMDAALLGAGALSLRLAGQAVPWKTLLLLHGACCLLHLQLACLCFALSAFLRRGGAGLGIGLAVTMYSLDVIANISRRARALKYLTPFAYCGGADILAAGRLDTARIAAGLLGAAVALAAAFRYYERKDIF